MSASEAMTKEVLEKAATNKPYAESLFGTVYTFGGEIISIESDYVVARFCLPYKDGYSVYSEEIASANVYLPVDDLISLEAEQTINLVGRLDELSSSSVFVFKGAAIVSDRFERSGKLHSQNAGYCDDAWNIEYPGNSYLSVVHFRDDVSSYKGQTITFTYKITGDGNVDAYIVE